ncbi:hypothetical protein J6590_050224 [Homalodisca vitripennis]|nr:hypothetical protein J6590_050224 [Homalodisca vitripennis]
MMRTVNFLFLKLRPPTTVISACLFHRLFLLMPRHLVALFLIILSDPNSFIKKCGWAVVSGFLQTVLHFKASLIKLTASTGTLCKAMEGLRRNGIQNVSNHDVENPANIGNFHLWLDALDREASGDEDLSKLPPVSNAVVATFSCRLRSRNI